MAKETFGGGMMWGTLAVSLTLTIGLFFAVPVLAAEAAVPVMPAGMSTGWLEAAIRLGLFLTYLWLIGYVPGVRRVFAYHGAEHKAINAYEAGEPLELERVLPYSTAHPRCGTTFVLYVVVVSALVFALLGSPALPLRVASRVVLVPVVASLAYEVTRLAGRWRYQPAARTLLAPGLALQALTTREPGAPEVEVALEALRRVLLREESHVTPP